MDEVDRNGLMRSREFEVGKTPTKDKESLVFSECLALFDKLQKH